MWWKPLEWRTLEIFWSDEEAAVENSLRLMTLTKRYTRKQALMCYKVTNTTGPTKEAMHDILEVFRDVFEFVVADNWTIISALNSIMPSHSKSLPPKKQ